MSTDGSILCDVGVPYPLASEIGRQMNAGVGTANLFPGVSATPAIELARQINANSFSAPLLCAAAWNPVTAIAIAALGASLRSIQLSAATVLNNATVGTTIGTLSVLNGSGSYTFTLTSNPGGLFAISGSNLNVAAALSIGSDPITVHADNGAGSVLNGVFLITVLNGSFVPTFELLGF